VNVVTATPDGFPLSAEQQFHWETLRFWSPDTHRAGRDGPFIAVRLSGAFDPDRFRIALAALVDRQEMLRVTLTDIGPDPWQRLDCNRELPLSFVDLTAEAEARRDAYADALVATERTCEFDLLKGPLWHCLVVGMARDNHILAFHFCHLIMDGVSLMSFLEQLSRLYSGEDVPRPVRQYRGFVAASHAVPPNLEERIARLRRDRLALAPIAFPTDYSLSSLDRLSPATLRFFRARGDEATREAGAVTGATTFMLYLAAYAIVLARTSGSDRLTFGSSIARLELRPDERLLGYFLDLMLISVRVSPRETLGELVANVRSSVWDAQANPLPYLTLARELNPRFDEERPWPAVNLYHAWIRGRVFETIGEKDGAPTVSFGKLTLSLYAAYAGYSERTLLDERQTSLLSKRYLPSLYIDDAKGSSGYLEYNSALFSARTIRRMSAHIDALIDLMRDPETPVDVAWNAVRRL
jgi:hypothetical protein